MLLEGRVAFLTGAGSGIGRPGALALARDAGDDAAVLAAINAVAARGGLDIRHSHAGIRMPGRLTEVSLDGMAASWRISPDS